MGKHNIAHVLILLLLNLGTLLTSLACPYCPNPTPTTKPPPKKPPKSPPRVKPPPHVPKAPPTVTKHPPHKPKSPVVKPPPPPTIPKQPPYVPKPPITKPPPYVPKPPPTVPKQPPHAPKPPTVPIPPVLPHPQPPPPNAQEMCPIDTLKLDACVDLLGGLIHIGIGASAKDTCCPVLKGLVDLDAALCLCTTIKAKLLNINILIPIALQVLVDCGKHPPSGFQCPA